MTAPMHVAAGEGDCEKIQKLLEQKANINVEDDLGCTPIFYAVRSKYRPTVMYLLSKGAVANKENKLGETCLHEAVQNDAYRLLLDFISFGLNINKFNKNGLSPLFLALEKQNPTTVKLLLKNGADFIAVNKRNGSNVLHYTWCFAEFVQRNKDQLQLLGGIDVNKQDTKGDTPLHLSAVKRLVSKWLVELGADLSKVNNEGNTILHCAAINNNEYLMVKCFERASNSVDEVNKYGDTALLLALKNRKTLAAKLLLSKNASAEISNSTGDFPLLFASRMGNVELMKMCTLSLINQANVNGTTPLLAAMEEETEAIPFLLDNGANLNVQDKEGMTPMHLATMLPLAILKSVMVKGNINKRNAKGETPLLLAVKCDSSQNIDYLLENRADPHIEDYHGNTCLHFAAKDFSLINKFPTLDVNKVNTDGDTPFLIGLRNGIHLPNGDIHYVNKSGQSALHCAAMSITSIETCFEKDHLNRVDSSGCTPLTVALDYLNLEAADYLISKGASFVENAQGESLLHIASKINNSMILRLVESGADVNKTNKEGNPPIFVALNNGRSEIVETLLSKNVDPLITNDAGENLLHVSVRCHDENAILYSLKNGVDVNSRNKEGETPLIVALKSRHVTVPHVLLRKKAQTTIADKHGNLPLHYAIKHDINIFRQCCDKVDINQENSNGETPLMLAFQNYRSEKIKYLETRGARLFETVKGCSALYYAVNMEIDIVKKCLEMGDNINKPDINGDTPLLHCLHYRFGDWEAVADFLILNNAQLDVTNKKGYSVLYYAAVCGSTKIMSLCLHAGVDINSASIYGETSILGAVLSYQPKITINYLLSEGAAVDGENQFFNTLLHFSKMINDKIIYRSIVLKTKDLNKTNYNVETPLHSALIDDMPCMAKLLLASGGVNPKLEDRHGRNALHLACEQGFVDIVDMLLKMNMNVNARDNVGKTAYMYAHEGRHAEVMEKLLANGANPNFKVYTREKHIWYAGAM